MKKLIIFFLVLGLSSCKDFLEEDPKGGVIGTLAIGNDKGLEAALTGTYKGFLRTWDRGFMNSSTQSFAMGGDDISTIKAGNEPKRFSREIDQFEVSTLNSHTNFIWRGCYKTIQGANNIINNYKNATGDQALITQIAGEAYFLRALAYYWLVRGFGSVPLVTTTDLTSELLNIKRSQPLEVYQLIEADLKMAEEMISNEKRDPGRPNKGTAKALLADVYLTEGGWPIKDQSKYSLAAAKAKEVIDNAATYGFDLVPLETLWGGNAAAIGTAEEVMSFHANSKFGGSTTGYYGSAGTPKEEGGWEDFCTEIHFFNKFPEGKRKDITFHTEFVRVNQGVTTVTPWQESAEKKPYFGKFRLENNNTWASSMPIHIIRYAHTLLVYAEAQARADGAPNSDAYAAINRIRERAGLNPLEGLSGPDFVKAVVDERAWEFAGEFTRWFDLVRLEMVEEANANKDPNDIQPIGAITKQDYIFPIPENEVKLNPNLAGE